MVRFGAVNSEATVWLDGQHVGDRHEGHTRFDLDITDVFATTTPCNHKGLPIRVFDPASNVTQSRGKQKRRLQAQSISTLRQMASGRASAWRSYLRSVLITAPKERF